MMSAWPNLQLVRRSVRVDHLVQVGGVVLGEIQVGVDDANLLVLLFGAGKIVHHRLPLVGVIQVVIGVVVL